MGQGIKLLTGNKIAVDQSKSVKMKIGNFHVHLPAVRKSWEFIGLRNVIKSKFNDFSHWLIFLIINGITSLAQKQATITNDDNIESYTGISEGPQEKKMSMISSVITVTFVSVDFRLILQAMVLAVLDIKAKCKNKILTWNCHSYAV